MTARRAVLAGLALVAIATAMMLGPARAADYRSAARVETIRAALTELRRDFPAALVLRASIRDEIRSRCRGSSGPLVVRCSLEVAGAACADAGPGCAAAADVVITNHVGDNSFVTDADRYRLMNEADNFREGLDEVLDHRYGLLAAELALAPASPSPSADPDLAVAIDAFCVTRARASRLPWQRCTSALLWFIGKESAR